VLDLTSVGSGLKFFDPSLAGSTFLLRLGLSSLILVWKISPKNTKFFKFFPSDQKKSLWAGSKSTQVIDRSTPFLLRIKSMLGLGQGPSLELTKLGTKFTPEAGNILFSNKYFKSQTGKS